MLWAIDVLQKLLQSEAIFKSKFILKLAAGLLLPVYCLLKMVKWYIKEV
jgi:hypothetical protein